MTDADRIRLLPPRQREVLNLLLAGASDKEISAQLGIAIGTTKVHVKTLAIIFDVRTRTKLMAKLMVPRFEMEHANG